ncbi:hypothetical protein [Singulisphaera sp. PoT]|uniref:hypothetical protein n=1 Tax=Singulisphaera sp. PoT TaxID=3411797 RepID=UPI003BF51615
MERVAWLLEQLRYPSPHTQAIVEHCRSAGTVEGCPWLKPEDRPYVQALLDDTPAPAASPVRKSRGQRLA